MAGTTYLWSTLTNNSTIIFDATVDVISFDDGSISAADRGMISGDWATNNVVFFVSGKSNAALNKTVNFTIVGGGRALTDSNVVYNNGTKLLIGDNTTFVGDGTSTYDDLPTALSPLTGGTGNDRLIGLGGNDTLDGGGGNDVFVLHNFGAAFSSGGSGDSVDGGAGFADSIGVGIYASTAVDEGSTVNFSNHTITSLDGTATFSNIEYAFGTNAADIFIALDFSRVLTGLGASNGNFDFARFLEGYGGSDSFTGDNRDGYFEAVSYASSQTGVTVDLSTGTASDGYDTDLVTSGIQSSTDTLVDIDGVQGSGFSDFLTAGGTGTTTFNGQFFQQLEGMGGNDTLDANGMPGVRAEYLNSPAAVTVNLAYGTASDGWGGTDRLIGIAGVRGSNFNDVIIGDDYDNFLEGRGGDDFFNGGSGVDRIFYSAATSGVDIDLATGTSSITGGQGTDSWVGIEGVRGGDFNDTLKGADGVDNVLEGLAGNDLLDGRTGTDEARYDRSLALVNVNLGFFGDGHGTASDGMGGTDTLESIESVRGSKFVDNLTGDNLANIFEGWAGNDIINGAGGFDTAQYSNSPGGVTVNLLSPTTVSDGWGGTDTLTSIENVTGSAFDDDLTGDAGGNIFDGGFGRDVVHFTGLQASYTVTPLAGGRYYSVTGPDGTDTVKDVERLAFSDFTQSLSITYTFSALPSGAAFYFDPALDALIIDGGLSATQLEIQAPIESGPNEGRGFLLESPGPSPRNISLLFTTGPDPQAGYKITSSNIVFQNGSLLLIGDNNVGTTGDDSSSLTLNGGAGNDVLVTVGGSQSLFGNGGDDQFVTAGGQFGGSGGSGTDFFNGGAGFDTLSLNEVAGLTGYTVNLFTGTGSISAGANSSVFTLTGIEALEGSQAADVLTGDGNANNLYGDSGNDTLIGGAGNDNLFGGNGNDTLTGGTGSDAFIFGEGNFFSGNAATITDFTSVDVIRLDASRFFGLGSTQNGTLDPTMFVSGPGVTTATTAAHRIIYNTTNGEVRLDADGNVGGPAVLLATLTGAPALSASNFTVFNGAGPIKWSSLTNQETYQFNPATSVLSFDDPSIAAGDTGFLVTWIANDLVFTVSGKSNPLLNKTVHFTVGGGGRALTDTNVTFANGSKLLIGDNTTSVGNGTSTFDDLANTLTGGAGNDRLLGLGGNDTLSGGAGNDQIVLSNGSNPFGNDTVDGGTDTRGGAGDWIGVGSSSLVLHGLAVDFNTHTLTSVDGTATFTNIENAFGTMLADTFTAFDSSRVLTGLGYFMNVNADFQRTLEGLAGNDSFTGDSRDGYSERVSYVSAPGGVTVNLSTGIASDGYGGTDTLAHIDGVLGSAFNDTLTGGGPATGYNGLHFENFEGMAGNDTINANGVANVQVNYNSSPAGVTVDLSTGTASDGWGDTDTLTGIVGVSGSNFNDTFIGDANDNSFSGNGGNDSFNGGAGMDRIFYQGAASALNIDLASGTSNNTDTGNSGTDTWVSIEGVRGGDFNDTLRGADGVDNVLEGLAGNDVLDGRTGTDEVRYDRSVAGVTVDLGLGTASDGLGGTDTLVSIERVRGSKFSDTLTGDGNDNILEGWAGNDTLIGGFGLDQAVYSGVQSSYTVTPLGGGSYTVTGPDGADTVSGIERLVFSNATQSLSITYTFSALPSGAAFYFDPALDVLSIDGGLSPTQLDIQAPIESGPNAGRGLMFETFGPAAKNVSLLFTTGPDPLSPYKITSSNVVFQNGSLLLVGDNSVGTGDDSSNVTLNGGAGNDVLATFGGSQSLFGNGGNDSLVTIAGQSGTFGTDAFDGGTGFDTLEMEGDTSSGITGYTVSLASGTGSVTGTHPAIFTLTGIEAIRGSDAADVFTGDANANNLYGRMGNDTLIGGAGNDSLSGGDGNDTLTGGTGNDAFIFDNNPFGPNIATITDFTPGVDGIRLDALSFSALGPNGTLNASLFVAGPGLTAATNSAQRIVYNTTTGDLYYDQDGVGLGSAVKFATLTGAPALIASNFSVFNGTGSIAWSSLTNEETYQFNPATSVLSFDDGSIAAGDSGPLISWVGNDVTFSVSGKSNGLLNKTVHFTVAGGGRALTDSNVTFFNGSKLLIGDNTTNVGNGSSTFDDAANTLTGGAGNDRLLGLGGNDTLNGGAGNDVIILSNGSGAFGNDIVDGGTDTRGGAGDWIGVGSSSLVLHGSTVDFNTHTLTSTGTSDSATFTNIENAFGTMLADTFTAFDSSRVLTGLGYSLNVNSDFVRSFEGYAGNDSFTGDSRDGYSERVSYAGAPGGVTVNLATGSASDGYGSTDTLASIDQVQGSAFSDTLIGGGTATSPNGLRSEAFEGMAGSDTINANGAPNSQALYNNSPAAVTVNLSTGTASDGWGGSDTLTGIVGVSGSSSNDTLIGDANDNFFSGGGGNDSFDGGAGTDRIFYQGANAAVDIDLALGTSSTTGGQGTDTWVSIEGVRGGDFNDTLRGADGVDNVLEGQAGNDLLDGRGGTDEVRYDRSVAGVTVDLGLGTASNDGLGGADTLVSIERVRGSKFADTLTGNTGDNGFEGWAGNDSITGGAGTDTAEYLNSPSGVTVNLGSNTASDGWGGTDSLSGIENVTGSAFNDSLTGDAGDNFLRGGLGADSLNGGAGADYADYFRATAGLTVSLANPASNTGEAAGDTYTSIERIRGGAFNDTLIGNAGDNVLRGGLGADSLNGGAGADYADYSDATAGLTVSLANPASNTGEAAGDAYISIERIRGSNFNDVLSGDASANSLNGGGGNDTLDGGTGFDAAVYAGVFRQSLEAGNAITSATVQGPEGSDTLTGVEKLVFVDGSLTFDPGANIARVERLYVATLGRLPDAQGLNFWLGNLDAGVGLNVMADTFVGSGEFQAIYGALSNSQFVNLVYQNVLHRNADAGGLAFWTNKLDTGTTRGEVVAAYSESSEMIQLNQALFDAGLWDIDETAASVARLYLGALGHAPTLAQLPNLVSDIAALKGLTLTLLQEANALAGSTEFVSAYGALSNAQYVSQLYLNLLGRAATGSEQTSGLNLLNTGHTRGEVLLGVTESQEYQAKVINQIDQGIAIDNVVQGTGGNDTLVGTVMSETLQGLGGDDSLSGAAANDTLNGGAGNDTLNGGTGFDTAAYAGAFRQYLATGNAITSGTVQGPEGTDTLTQIERLSFVDGSLNFDPASHIAQVTRLYLATLDRLPDALGLNFWLGVLDRSVGQIGLNTMASSFVGSSEFQSNYGSLSNSQFVDQLYQNVLDRAADAGGLAFWTGQLDLGATRGQVVASFSESSEMIQINQALFNAGIWDIDETAASVARLYLGGEGHGPTVLQLTNDTLAVKGGTLTLVQEANNVAASTEFVTAYGALTNAQYVDQLYLNVLNRAATGGEQASGLNLLNTGHTRGEVLLSVTESQEYQVKVIGQIDHGIAATDAHYP